MSNCQDLSVCFFHIAYIIGCTLLVKILVHKIHFYLDEHFENGVMIQHYTVLLLTTNLFRFVYQLKNTVRFDFTYDPINDNSKVLLLLKP